MITIPIIVFIASLAGIVLLFMLKRWELQSRKIYLSVARAKTDIFTLKLAEKTRSLMRTIPGAGSHVSRQITHHIAYHTSAIVLKLIQAVEGKLLKFINMIKGKGVVKDDRVASQYLRDVSDHRGRNLGDKM